MLPVLLSKAVSNEDRAQRARDTLDAYIVESDDKENALCDLLADLMHRSAIDCEADDFDCALETARGHFNAEISEEQS